MTSRRFPRSPEVAQNPFSDGSNPFADDVTTPIPVNENPLGGPVTNEVQPYQPTEYVETLPDRSNRVLVCGLIGTGFIALSVLILVVVITTTPLWSPQVVYCFPADLLGLAFTIPAWIMGASDLRAIRAHAMSQLGLSRTRVGYWCGCIGTLVGVAPFLAALTAIVGGILS